MSSPTSIYHKQVCFLDLCEKAHGLELRAAYTCKNVNSYPTDDIPEVEVTTKASGLPESHKQ